ncbi:MAG TPA: hypothetical protein VG755_25510, partial [Nannocystaceae bacterium]|nr:hypothetical protein [Nannocystaceae bacterium]
VYALGCCAYEMVTGRLLIDDGCTVERAVAQHLDGIEAGLVFPPEAKVPACVEALVRRCLARDPARRPASMAELEAELCEAQIECRLAPTREDLELPDVDRMRRDGIAIGFAGMLAPRRGAWLERGIFGTAMTAMAATALAVLATHIDPEPLARRMEVAPVAAPRASEATLLATTIETPALARAVAPTRAQESFAPEPPASAVAPAAIAEPTITRAPTVTRAPVVARLDPPRKQPAPKTRDQLREEKQLASREVWRDPSSARAHLRLGDALNRLGRSQAAARQYRAAARLGSHTAERRLRTLARD